MESFHLPVAAIVALVVSLSALAFTAYDPGMWLYPSSAIGNRDMAFTTECDRLVLRYLLSDKPSFERLTGAMQKFSGEEPYEMLLNSTERAFNYNSRISKDKFYLLRGKILLKLGRDVEAKENFRSALRWNVDNSQARKNPRGQHAQTGPYGVVTKEMGEALDNNPGEDESGRYHQIPEKIKLASPNLNI